MVPATRDAGAAGVQVGLPLEMGVPRPEPRAIDPEAATPCAAAFDGDDWLFGVDWEGSRCLLVAERDGEVRLQGVNGSLGTRFPEIVAGAGEMRPGTVIDGVVCTLDGDGRADLQALAQRMAGAERPHALLLATDLLFAAGLSMLNRPLEERLQRLSAVVTRDSRVQVPDVVEAHGVALAAAAAEHGVNAILCRRRSGAYHPGVASPDRLRVDLTGQRTLVVAGIRGSGAGRQLVLGEWVDGHLSYAGSAPLDEEEVASVIFERFSELAAEVPLVDADRVPGTVTWVRPRLTATCAAGDVPAGTLRLLAVRDDVDTRWCVRRAAVAPPLATATGPVRPFSPTVLHALPLDAA